MSLLRTMNWPDVSPFPSSAGQAPACVGPTLEALEERLVLTASAADIYAWDLVNQMRADPTRFAAELQGMIDRTAASAHGYGVDDPVWQDLRASLDGNSTPGNTADALALLRAQPNLGPLAYEDRLATISEQHNDWMATHCFAHSWYEGNSFPGCAFGLPGLPQPGIDGDYNVVNFNELQYPDGTVWSDGSWGENIGFAAGGSMPATRAAFGEGSDAHRQRQAYHDTISFVLEINGPTDLGHLKILLARDHTAGGQPTGNGIVVGNAFGNDFWHNDPGFASGGTNLLTTHTTSTHQLENGEGGYVSGLAFADGDGDALYDVGEAAAVSWTLTYTDQAGAERTISVGADPSSHGRLSQFVPANGLAIVTATDATGAIVGQEQVTIANANVGIAVPVGGGGGGGGTTVQPNAGFTAELAVFRDGVFHVDTAVAEGTVDLTHAFGARGDQGLVADWNGDNRLDFIVYRGNTFLIDTDRDGVADDSLAFGDGDDKAFVADFNRDGRIDAIVYDDSPAVSTWRIDYGRDGSAEFTMEYGIPGDRPFIGDWDGNGTLDLGLYRNGPATSGNPFMQFFFDTAGDGGAGESEVWFGVPGDEPFLGDFDGDGRLDPGVFRFNTEVIPGQAVNQFLFDLARDGASAENEIWVRGAVPGDSAVLIPPGQSVNIGFGSGSGGASAGSGGASAVSNATIRLATADAGVDPLTPSLPSAAAAVDAALGNDPFGLDLV